jgi:sec-independent protein translocase protein TatA
VLLVFGAGKLPQIGDALGKSIKNFKRAAGGKDEIEVTPKKEISEGKPPADAPKNG